MTHQPTDNDRLVFCYLSRRVSLLIKIISGIQVTKDFLLCVIALRKDIKLLMKCGPHLKIKRVISSNFNKQQKAVPFTHAHDHMDRSESNTQMLDAY